MFQVMLLALFIAVAQGAHAAVYKCEINGKIEFSDRPCAPNAAPVNLDVARPNEADAARAQERARENVEQADALRQREALEQEKARAESNIRLLELQRQGVLKELAWKKKIAIGMTEDQVEKAWGKPTKINRTVSSSTVNEQWVYRRGDAYAQYVYLKNGVVTSWQD
jgi:hypothetical protein